MGALEGEILAALWAADEAVTPHAVAGVIGGDLAYTTVVTILTRLVEKGLVGREPSGRTFLYAPVVSEGALTAARMGEALASSRDRDAALSHFVSNLSRREVQALRKVLEGS